MAKYDFELLYDKWVIDKDPEAVRNYGIDWTRLLPAGDSIASVIWTLGGTVTNPSGLQQIVGNVTFIRIAGGDLGETPWPSARAKITTALSAEILPITLYFNMVQQ